jgi:plastocyanin
MRITRWCLFGAAALSLGGGAVPAEAENPKLPSAATVVATPFNKFAPDTVVIRRHGTVTWQNMGGFHNVVFEDGSFTSPASPSPELWTVSRSFDKKGVYRYYCQQHRAQGMTGVVIVGPPRKNT